MASDVYLMAGLLLAAAVSTWHLERLQTETIVVYTTPALRDVLEKDIIPRFRDETGHRVAPIYVSAGAQYNRLRMSGDPPEADLFIHASPLFIEKGFKEGYFERFPPTVELPPAFGSNRSSDGVYWQAFSWSPLVEVYSPRFQAPPDLARAEIPFGLAHPLLSNNGIYTVAFFENVSRDAGRHALAQTVVQPVNARANIDGVATQAFDVTIGYEAIVRFFQRDGVEVDYAFPIVDGRNWTLPVVFSAGLVKGHSHPGGADFLHFLFSPETQANLARFDLRPFPATATPDWTQLGIPAEVEMVPIDWTQWEALEAALPNYEV